MASLGPIKLGTKDKRAYFNYSHDVNSTLGFGFFEPTMCLDCIPDMRVNLKATPAVRLAPLPQPTTGLITVHNYYSFVKTEEVFEAFENLQSQTTVRSSRGSYIPSSANTLDNFKLFYFLLWLNRRNFFNMYNPNYTNRDLNGVFFTFSITTNYNIWDGTPSLLHNLFDDVLKTGTGGDEGYEPFKALKAFWDTAENVGTAFDKVLREKLFGGSWSAPVEHYGDAHWLWSNTLAGGFDDVFNSKVIPSWVYQQDYGNYVTWLRNLKQSDFSIFSAGRSYENADFILEIDASRDDVHFYRANTITESDEIGKDDKLLYVGIHLTPAGKRLFKIFNACEFNFGSRAQLETDKLRAYYKAWFDIFNPGRNLQWKDTHCYQLIHSFYDSPSYSDSYYVSQLAGQDNTIVPSSEMGVSFIEFWTDLVECYYSEKINPITVATDVPVTNVAASSPTTSNFTLFTNSAQRYPGGADGYGTTAQDGLGVRWLETFYRLVNKNSVIGQRVALYMKEHFGIDMPKTSMIDKKQFDVNIVDAVASVNNDETLLGEYGGLGKGRGINGINYECKKHGYLFQFVVVVPRGGYVQAGKLAKVNRLDWYQQAYDSLGMEVLSRYEVASRNSVISTWQNTNLKFGFRPRYMSYKYKNNLANGGFSFRSERSGYLGYSMDKIFTEPDYMNNQVLRSQSEDVPVSQGGLRLYEGAQLAPDEELRYIGKNEAYGNYNRIFYDTTGATDNFIYFCHNEVKVYAPMKPIEASWETYDETSDTDTISVEHS